MFFDNWRVQRAMTGRGMNQSSIDSFETEYDTATPLRRDEIFKIYQEDVQQIHQQELLGTIIFKIIENGPKNASANDDKRAEKK